MRQIGPAHLIAAVAIGAGSFTSAQCVSDADGDGHPLFFSTYVRASVLYFDDDVQFIHATDVAFGDIDGDGDPDAVFCGASQGMDITETTYITVTFNHGDGVFDGHTVYHAGAEVCAVELGDLDGDGDLDLAAANARDDTVSVFLNDGDGVFDEERILPVGKLPRSLIVQDFNADGLADVAALNIDSDDLSVLLAAGAGEFLPEHRVDAGGVSARANQNPFFPYPGPFMTSGDVDGDGLIDLAIPSGGSVNLLLGDGAGGFTLLEDVIDVVGSSVYDIVIEDFDHDGLMDVAAAVTGHADAAVSVVFQERPGEWSAPAALDANVLDCDGCFWVFVSVDAGDVNGDGLADIVVGQEIFDFGAVFLNEGGRSFGSAQAFSTLDFGPWVVELEDLNADGRDDLAYIDAGLGNPNGMHVWMNDGQGAVVGPGVHLVDGGRACDSVEFGAGADMDGDGAQDIVTSIRHQNCDINVRVFAGDGAGSFTNAAEISVGPAGEVDSDHLALVDMTGDGLPDIVLADRGPNHGDAVDPGAIHVIVNEGGMRFAAVASVQLDATIPRWIEAVDVNGDGATDVVAWSRQVTPKDLDDPVDRFVEVFLNDGTGTLEPIQKILLESAPHLLGLGGVASGDLDGDGDADLLATTGSTDDLPGNVWLLVNDGQGPLHVDRIQEVGRRPFALAIGDFDQDGDSDAALAFQHNSTNGPPGYLLEPYLVIFSNDGAGNLTVSQSFVDPNARPGRDVQAADLDGDGWLDLAIPDSRGSLRVHLNQGDGSYGEGTSYDAAGHALSQAVADFDSDGRPDVALFSTDEIITLLFNRACPACPADINDDGALDVLDFIAFQIAFQAADPVADCDRSGTLDNPLDFLCFQQTFLNGCD